MDCAPTPDRSLLTIKDKELPYSRLVSLTTPSLHLKLDALSLTFDFFQVLSGCLSLVQIGDNTELSRGYRTVEVENIPTTAELKMDCSRDSNELAFQLRVALRGFVCISFYGGKMSPEICYSLQPGSKWAFDFVGSTEGRFSSEVETRAASASIVCNIDSTFLVHTHCPSMS